ncbi:MAG TPA: histidinol dehydrogenase [Candidatus Binataceae bacterium]|nr:histidinol dehydrogenase [Candidatus Binataceae bacterium]
MRPRILKSGGTEFREFMAAIAARRGGRDTGVDSAASRIVEAVRKRGDRALIDLTYELDNVRVTRRSIRVSAAELRAAPGKIAREDLQALKLAARRIADFHRRTMEKSFVYRDKTGLRLGQIVSPLRRVGIYVPGGMGAYPSSVLMNAIPAKVAGVEEIVMVSPPAPGGDRPGVLAAAAIAGVDEVYRVGGAQSIAALAYGTETIQPVDKIVGPGNAFVQAAKRMVYGLVDIDKMAGPSEVLVIADTSAKPRWIAADLIAQAEHGSGDETAILLTPSAALAARTADEIETALKSFPRGRQAGTAIARRGAMVVVRDLNEAFEISNRIGPEHLELEIRQPSKWLPRVKAAGAVFLGQNSPAPLGDYLAGPNHVLPTGGAARFASPLGAYDFFKRTSIIEASREAVIELGPAVAHLARMEGFEGHARAMELRLAELDQR